jgi:hypothetical protein
MALAGLGLNISETELRALCDCTEFGTEALKALDAVRQLGFTKSAKHNLAFDELESLVAAGHFPIAFVNLDPIDGINDSHALVITETSRSGIVGYDPLHGERVLPPDTFRAAWAMMNNLVILIEK